ncbi:hypothetical protein TSUD_145590 [Trifolium subterraneum]|uniref:Reverse transcriptase zinc-binding domain-containing protein n=1 Tax=Trifolium subterraneum TaxID=3900 RepID=A0A2Z6N9P9_TRISU|nr:hypothetical protein TSUD_145590 [Trifolium subterraneum]
MSVIVWKKIVQIQWNFLWGGHKSVRKIAWVSWDKVCQSKRDGGLGIIDLRAVNLELLGKWRWRLISGGVGLWRDIILATYGSLFPSPHLGGRLGGLRKASCWWRNVSLLGDPEDAISDWFLEGVAKKVGNGRLTSFWFDPWLDGVPSMSRFQRLFKVSAHSSCMVGDMGSWVEGQWIWVFRWRRDLFVWELNLLESLHEILNHSTISTVEDSWFWMHDPSGHYSVKSAFLALSCSTANEVIFSVEEKRLLPKVWKTWAPSNVAVFSWQLLQDRLPTRQNLWKRGVIGDVSASTCVLCGLEPETADHLFGSCNQISQIWYGILRWLGVELVPSHGVLGFF